MHLLAYMLIIPQKQEIVKKKDRKNEKKDPYNTGNKIMLIKKFPDRGTPKRLGNETFVTKTQFIH